MGDTRDKGDPDDEWERSELALKKLQLESQGEEEIPSPCDSSPSDGLNSALIDALQNPRERMNVLKYEDRILRFVKSTDSFLDVPPISNSYQRLLIYRVAQRFGLEHNVSETQNECGDRGIIFFKTSATAIPPLLLINFKNEEISPQQPSTARGPSKIVVMQRRSSASTANMRTSSAGDKNQSSVSEREKAYAAARARIFGEENSSDSSPSPSEASNADVDLSGIETKLEKGDKNRASSSKMKQSNSRCENEEGIAVKDKSPSRVQKKKVVDAGNWKEKKVLLRDKQAERFDPDFARFPSSSQLVPPPLSYNLPVSPPPPLPQTTSYSQPITQLYPPTPVMHQPPTQIALGLPVHSAVVMQSWNTPSVNMVPSNWTPNSPNQINRPVYGSYDYQPYPPPNIPRGLPPNIVPLAPGLPEHLLSSKSNQSTQQAYNREFPPLS